jgi:hypothetical protein
VDVVTSAVASFNGKVLGDGGLEPGSLDGNGVVSDRKECEAIIAGAVGLCSAFLVGAEVDERDRGVRNDSASGIGDRSDDVGGGQLRERSGG